MVCSALSAGLLLAESAATLGASLSTADEALLGTASILWFIHLGYTLWVFMCVSSKSSRTGVVVFRSPVRVGCFLWLLWITCLCFSVALIVHVLVPFLRSSAIPICSTAQRAASVSICVALGITLLITAISAAIAGGHVLHLHAIQLGAVGTSPRAVPRPAQVRRAGEGAFMLSEGKHTHYGRRHSRRELDHYSDSYSSSEPGSDSSASSRSSSGSGSGSGSDSSSSHHSEAHPRKGKHSHSRTRTHWDIFKERLTGTAPSRRHHHHGERKNHGAHKHVRIDEHGNEWVTTLVGGQRTTIEIPATKEERKRAREKRRRERHKHDDDDGDDSDFSFASASGSFSDEAERRHHKNRERHKSRSRNRNYSQLESSTQSGLVNGMF